MSVEDGGSKRISFSKEEIPFFLTSCKLWPKIDKETRAMFDALHKSGKLDRVIGLTLFKQRERFILINGTVYFSATFWLDAGNGCDGKLMFSVEEGRTKQVRLYLFDGRFWKGYCHEGSTGAIRSNAYMLYGSTKTHGNKNLTADIEEILTRGFAEHKRSQEAKND
jgi:hypothetical protein